MKFINKIKTYSEIKAITNSAEKQVFKSFIAYKTENSENLKIGILLSKKFGKAVKRNFARRRLIASLNNLPKNSRGTIVFIPRNKILTIDFEELKKEVVSIFVLPVNFPKNDIKSSDCSWDISKRVVF